jgi:ATP-binding cassette subfamily B protein
MTATDTPRDAGADRSGRTDHDPRDVLAPSTRVRHEGPFYRGPFRTTWRLLGPRRRILSVGIALRLVQSIFMGVPVALLVQVIQQIRDDTLTAGDAWLVVVIVAVSFVGQFLAALASNRLSWISTYLAIGEARLDVLDHVQQLPLGTVMDRGQGDVTNVVSSDLDQVSMFASHSLPVLIGGAGLPVVVLVLLVFVDAPLALAVFVSVAAAIPVFIGINRYFRRAALARADHLAVAASRIVEYVQGIAVVRSFNQVGPKLGWFRDAVHDMRRINDQMAVKLTPWAFVAIGTLLLGVPITLAALTYWWFGGRIDVGTALVFCVLVLRVYQPLLQVAVQVENLRMADAALERIGRVMDLDPQVAPRVAHRQPADASVEFDDVSFGYVEGRPVLEHVSFTARPGTLTAVVGPSGAGKSTLLHLVSRFWDPGSGTVFLGGIDVRELTSEQVFDSVTMVFQDVVLFQGSIRDNIALGRAGAAEGDIVAAATAAQAHDFITALPDGYDTRVGEGGATLSGGERQRISIARAMLKDAPIVLLDEATASIDPLNERAVRAALAHLVAERTVIVVAHRLATIASADEILVVAPPSAGAPSTIVERGTHDQLLGAGGLYAHLWAERARASAWRIPGGTSAGTL